MKIRRIRRPKRKIKNRKRIRKQRGGAFYYYAGAVRDKYGAYV
jgi:hypothetical protein